MLTMHNNTVFYNGTEIAYFAPGSGDLLPAVFFTRKEIQLSSRYDGAEELQRLLWEYGYILEFDYRRTMHQIYKVVS